MANWCIYCAACLLSAAGLNPSMNVNCMEVGLGMKEPPQPQSRLSQWTHANSMDSGPHMEPGLSKHGKQNRSRHCDVKILVVWSKVIASVGIHTYMVGSFQNILTFSADFDCSNTVVKTELSRIEV